MNYFKEKVLELIMQVEWRIKAEYEGRISRQNIKAE
jgi:hypothetical protein